MYAEYPEYGADFTDVSVTVQTRPMYEHLPPLLPFKQTKPVLLQPSDGGHVPSSTSTQTAAYASAKEAKETVKPVNAEWLVER